MEATRKKNFKLSPINNQSGAVAKSYINNDLLIDGEILTHLLIY
jgi:hypothetical protein